MKYLLLLLLATNALGITPEHEKQLKAKKEITYDDLAHINPHCPENSDCSKASGEMILKWEQLTKNKSPKMLPTFIEKFRMKYGIPVHFLTTEKSKTALDPIIFDSRCRHHFNEDSSKKIVKGLKFFRNNPKSELVKFIPITILSGKNKGMKFEIPYGEQPLLMDKNKLISIVDYEDTFYPLSITTDGKWEVFNLDHSLNEIARDKKENNISCPEKKEPDQYFLGSYCTKIWDNTQKEMILIEQMWTCP